MRQHRRIAGGARGAGDRCLAACSDRRRRHARAEPAGVGRRGRGSAVGPRLARLRRERRDRPAVDWVTPFEERPAARSRVQVFGDLGRGVQPVHRPTPRIRRASRRPATPAAARRGRLRRSRSTRPHPELCERLRRPQGQAAQHGRRRPLRRAPRPRLEPAHVADRRRQPRPDDMGRRCSTGGASSPARSASTTRRSTSPTRPSTSWRPSPTSASRTRTRSTTPSSRRRSTCSKQQKPKISQYWVRLHEADGRVHATAT